MHGFAVGGIGGGIGVAAAGADVFTLGVGGELVSGIGVALGADADSIQYGRTVGEVGFTTAEVVATGGVIAIVRQGAKEGVEQGLKRADDVAAATRRSTNRPHGNSHDFVGETHVYAIRGPDGAHKIGQSMQGVRKADGASIRAEQQVRRLNHQTGTQDYRSQIRRMFRDKHSAYQYDQRYVETFRRLFGQNTLPGNRGVH